MLYRMLIELPGWCGGEVKSSQSAVRGTSYETRKISCFDMLTTAWLPADYLSDEAEVESFNVTCNQ